MRTTTISLLATTVVAAALSGTAFAQTTKQPSTGAAPPDAGMATPQTGATGTTANPGATDNTGTTGTGMTGNSAQGSTGAGATSDPQALDRAHSGDTAAPTGTTGTHQRDAGKQQKKSGADVKE
jgi:hypothetical protein